MKISKELMDKISIKFKNIIVEEIKKEKYIIAFNDEIDISKMIEDLIKIINNDVIIKCYKDGYIIINYNRDLKEKKKRLI